MKFKIIDNIYEYIDDIIELDDDFYDESYLWTNEYQKSIYERNNDSFIAVSYNDILIGYLNYLCISEATYYKIKASNITVDEFELNNILPFNKGDNYLTINSIVIKKEYQDGEVIKLLLDGLCKKIKELEDHGYFIKGINGVAVSDDGKKVFENLGFNKSKLLDDGNTLYYLEDNIYNTVYNSLNKLKNK